MIHLVQEFLKIRGVTAFKVRDDRDPGFPGDSRRSQHALRTQIIYKKHSSTADHFSLGQYIIGADKTVQVKKNISGFLPLIDNDRGMRWGAPRRGERDEKS